MKLQYNIFLYLSLLPRTEPDELSPGVGSWIRIRDKGPAEASLVLLPGLGHGHSDLETNGPGQGWRHGVTNLTVLLRGGPMELVGVGEPLRPGPLSDTEDPDNQRLKQIYAYTTPMTKPTCSGQGVSLCLHVVGARGWWWRWRRGPPTPGARRHQASYRV